MSKKYLANLYSWTRGSEAIHSVRMRVAPVGGPCCSHLIMIMMIIVINLMILMIMVIIMSVMNMMSV